MTSMLTAEPKIGLFIDRDSHTIRLIRDFAAPRAQVFEAWTDPDQVTVWWDPTGEPLASCEIDLKPGGAFRFVNTGHSDMAFAGTYVEIAPPDRLVFEAMGATGRVMLEGSAEDTRMVVEIACRSADHLEQFLKVGVATDTARTLDNLVVFVHRA